VPREAQLKQQLIKRNFTIRGHAQNGLFPIRSGSGAAI
jgi:hypothetical protein